MNELLERYLSSAEIAQITEALNGNATRLRLKGMAGSMAAVVGGAVHKSLSDKTLLFIAENKERAYYLCNDLESLFGETDTELSDKDIGNGKE